MAIAIAAAILAPTGVAIFSGCGWQTLVFFHLGVAGSPFLIFVEGLPFARQGSAGERGRSMSLPTAA